LLLILDFLYHPLKDIGFLIAIDVTSRFIMAKPFFKKDKVLKILFKIFTTEGAPKFIMSDLGSKFTNKLIFKIKEKLKIVDHISSVARFKIGMEASSNIPLFIV
jgi:hypothetical protein